MNAMRGEATLMRILMTIVGVGVEAGIGILIIVNSRKITDLLLKGEED